MSVNLFQQRAAVEAFLSALRAGDIEGLLAILDPDVVRRADKVALPHRVPRELHGAIDVAKEALAYARTARIARPMLVMNQRASWWPLEGSRGSRSVAR